MADPQSIRQYVVDGRMGRASKFGGIISGHVDGHPEQRVSIKKLERYADDMPEKLSRLQSLDRPDVASIREFFVEDDGCLYIVRNFVEGTDFKSILSNKKIYGRIDEQNFVKMGCAVLEALQAVHGVGLVHRDVKPSNIVLRHAPGQDVLEADFSQVALIDFEQCSIFPDNGAARASFALIYSPPEMLLKHNDLVGPQADLFALAIAIYHLVMGKTPYEDCNPEVLINLQLTYPMRKPGRMTDELFAVLDKAAHKESFRLPPRKLSFDEVHETLARGIDGRYQSAADMLADLRGVQQALKPANWWQKIFD